MRLSAIVGIDGDGVEQSWVVAGGRRGEGNDLGWMMKEAFREKN
jgi:hypothetical protein